MFHTQAWRGIFSVLTKEVNDDNDDDYYFVWHVYKAQTN